MLDAERGQYSEPRHSEEDGKSAPAVKKAVKKVETCANAWRNGWAAEPERSVGVGCSAQSF
jgi:hypothetical protein